MPRRAAPLQPRPRTRSCSGSRSAATACSASSRRSTCGSCRGRRSSASSKMLDVEQLRDAFDERIADGYLYGDFQFCDRRRTPTTSCAAACSPATGRSPTTRRFRTARSALSAGLAAAAVPRARDKRAAFESTPTYYLATAGQIYWSDTHQLSPYLDDYHAALDRAPGASVPASEMITELYVPRAACRRSWATCGATPRQSAPTHLRHDPPDRADDESFLPGRASPTRA